MVQKAYEKIPQQFRDKIDNVAITVEDYPSAQDLETIKIRGKGFLLDYIEVLHFLREAFGRELGCRMKLCYIGKI